MHDITADECKQVYARSITGNPDEVDGKDEEGLQSLEAGVLNPMEKDLSFAGVMVALARVLRKARVFGEAKSSGYHGVEQYLIRFGERTAAKKTVKRSLTVQDRRPRINVLEE